MQAVFNILAICGSAWFSGAMLCIGLTLGGYWRSLPPDEFLTWFAANNQLVARTIPVTVVPACIGLVGSIWMAWGTSASTLTLWVLRMVCFIGVLVFTFAYFVPTNTAFASGSFDVAEVPAKLNQWISLHYFRIGGAMLGAVLGCLAMRG